MNVRSIVLCMVLAAGGLLMDAESPWNPSDITSGSSEAVTKRPTNPSEIAAGRLPTAAKGPTNPNDISADSDGRHYLLCVESGSKIQWVNEGRHKVRPYLVEKPAEDPMPAAPPDVGEF